MPEMEIKQHAGSGGDSLRHGRGGSLRYGQGLTVSLLFGGYAALYFCRADLSVGTPAHHRGIGTARLEPRRRRHPHGFDRLSGRAGVRARQAVSGRPGRYLGRTDQLLDRPRRRSGLYAAVRDDLLRARVYPRLVRQSADPVGRLGGAPQSIIEMVRLFIVRHHRRHPQHQLPHRRCRRPTVDGTADRARCRMAHTVLSGRGGLPCFF